MSEWSYKAYCASIAARGVGSITSGYWTYPGGPVTWLDPQWRDNPVQDGMYIDLVEAEIGRRIDHAARVWSVEGTI